MTTTPDGKYDIVIDLEHYKVHDGELFTTSQYFTIASAATGEFFINVGADEPHAKLSVVASGQSLIKFYEGITTSANGTSVSVYNLNRNSSNSVSSVFFHTPTWSTNSEIILDTVLIPGGTSPPSRVGGEGRQKSELELMPSTKYLLQITNQAGATIGATVNMQFYEE